MQQRNMTELLTVALKSLLLCSQVIVEVIGIASTSVDWVGQGLPDAVYERAHSMLKTLFESQGAEKVSVSDCLAGTVLSISICEGQCTFRFLDLQTDIIYGTFFGCPWYEMMHYSE